MVLREFSCAAGQLITWERVEHRFQTGPVIAPVIADRNPVTVGNRPWVRHVGLGEQVAPPDLVGAQADLAGRGVEAAFQGERRLGPAGTAVLRDQRLVGQRRAARNLCGRYAIRAEQVDRGVGDDAGHPQASGADVDHEIVRPGQDVAFPIDRESGAVHLVSALRAGQQVLLTILDPDQPAAGVPGEQRQQDLFSVYVGLRTEAAAHVGNLDLDVLA